MSYSLTPFHLSITFLFLSSNTLSLSFHSLLDTSFRSIKPNQIRSILHLPASVKAPLPRPHDPFLVSREIQAHVSATSSPSPPNPHQSLNTPHPHPRMSKPDITYPSPYCYSHQPIFDPDPDPDIGIQPFPFPIPFPPSSTTASAPVSAAAGAEITYFGPCYRFTAPIPIHQGRGRYEYGHATIYF